MKTRAIITLLLVTLMLTGCAVSESGSETEAPETAETPEAVEPAVSDQQVTVDIIGYDGIRKTVTTTEEELDGVNGCFMYEGTCYIKSDFAEHDGAYVPEGTDFLLGAPEVE